MARTRANCDGAVRSGVMPVLRPTVPIALAASKARASKEKAAGSSQAVSHKASRPCSTKMSEQIRTERRMMPAGMRRPRMTTSRWPRIRTIIAARKIQAVVVFMPPAVPPGAPPSSISGIIVSSVIRRASPRSTIEKPAVRVVLPWNRASTARCGAE